MQGAWKSSGVLTGQPFPRNKSILWKHDLWWELAISTTWGTRGHKSSGLLFLLHLRPPTYLSAQWLLFSFVTGSYSLAPSKHTHHDTLPWISWAHQPLPASGSSHILIYCRVLLFLLLPPFWFCWANSNSSFHFNFNMSSSERHSWPPPHTNSYLPIMVSHGAIFFFFLTHM